MSLKKRIISWFLIWNLILMALIFVIFFSLSSQVRLRGTRHDIERTLSKAARSIIFKDGEPDFSNLEKEDDGVWIYVLSRSDLSLLFGNDDERIRELEYREGARVINIEKREYIISDMAYGTLIIRAVSESNTFLNILRSDYMELLLIAPILVLIAFIGGYVIVKRSFSPLDEIIRSASEIADADDLNQSLKSQGGREIQELTKAFNAMLFRLERSFKREKEFSSDASHELRTPLSIIRAEGEYALTVLGDRKETEESIIAIIDECDKMSALIDSLLFLSRHESGKIEVHKERFDLSLLVNKIAKSMKEIAKENNRNLIAEDNETSFIYADEMMAERAIINLISNAIQYTMDGGIIKVRLENDGKEARLKIIDNGIGIKKEDHARIFDRFFQVDKSRTSSSSGLGLSIVKEIANLNDIKIRVESEENKGSTFTLIFKTLE